jgi:hypothetical protein
MRGKGIKQIFLHALGGGREDSRLVDQGSFSALPRFENDEIMGELFFRNHPWPYHAREH